MYLRKQRKQSKRTLYPLIRPFKEAKCKPYVSPSRPYIRYLKVYYAYQSGNFLKPLICLNGRWLQDAGFAVGDRIRVMVKDNQLVIEPAK
jgi:hypothetical protein